MLGLLALPLATPAQTGTALVRHAPTINGRVEGSIQVMTAENVTLGNGAAITGNLLVPGLPSTSATATAMFGGVLDAPGAAAPSNHTVTFNTGSSLGGLVRRADAVVMPVVPAVPAPSGTRIVTITAASQSPGDFGTLKSLTLESNVGSLVVPPGNYGDFFSYSGSGFVLGFEGATTPAIYNFKSLGMLSGSVLRVVGPIVVTADLGRILGVAGQAEHPEWLSLKLGSGSILSSNAQDVSGYITMPTGMMNLGTNSRFKGKLVVDSLTVATGAVVRLIGSENTPPQVIGFESGEGYALGSLHGQSGWLAGSGVTNTEADAAAGQRSVLLPGVTPPTSLLRLFEVPALQSVVFAEVFLLPYAATDADAASQLRLHNAAQLGFVRAGEQGRFMYRVGDGTGGGVWRLSATGLPLDAQGYAADWLRVTLRLDYATKEWDFYVNGTMVAAAIGFEQASQSGLTALTLTGQTAVSTLLDEVLVVFENPLFADADRDGLDDVWEVAKGLNPTLNDRTADADEDGVSNLEEFTRGTHPTEADTDRDGLSDGQEIQAGTDPRQLDTDGDGLADGLEVLLGYDPTQPQPGVSLTTDADGDGLTLEQELRLGTDPVLSDNLGSLDRDGDGLPDKWELVHGLNPLVTDIGGIVNEDADGDGLTLIHEAQVGANPQSADTDGDGMRDDYEVHRDLNPLTDDSAADPDGDGLDNREEHRRGTDPRDYYNGIAHEILPLIGGDFDLGAGGVMAVRVVDSAGNPLVNAPVTLTIESGDSQIALTSDGPLVGQTAEVRTGPDGIARAYLRTP